MEPRKLPTDADVEIFFSASEKMMYAMLVAIYNEIAELKEAPSGTPEARTIESATDGLWFSSVRSRAYHSSLDDEIDHIYNRISFLTHEQPADGDHNDEEIERLYAELLHLQTAEAREFRRQFEASLAMPIDAGERILQRIRALREELEDLASADATAYKADTT